MKNFTRIASLLTVLFMALSPFASFAPVSVSAYGGCCYDKPDLVAVKTNDLGGEDAIVGVSFNWIITVTNNGTATAIFDKGEKILQDNLPSDGVGPYGTVSVSPSAGVTGVPENLTCTQASTDNRDLTCKVVNTYGRQITIPAGDYIVFSVVVTPDAAGSLSNPRSGYGNQCKVDPSYYNGVIPESDENNNNCSNSVTVIEGCITNDDCDDDLYCNGEEICVDNECVQGTPIDCSVNDISGIATCDNDSPYDGNSYTWDFRNAFESQCNEDTDECTTGDETIFSTCSVDDCQAGCDAQNPCADTDCYQNECIGNDLYTNTDVANSCQGDCTCTQNECEEPNISHNDPACTECQIDDDCNSLNSDPYCDGTFIKHDEGICVNYECEVNTITDQDCDNGFACDGQEICSEGNCVGGEPVDCSQYNLPEINTCTYDPDGNSYTLDYRTEFTSVCQEPEGTCSAAGDITHTCDEQCGAGCTSDEDCDDDNPDTIDRCSACQCTHNQTPPVCGNEEKEEGEECDGADGVTPGENFCTVNCQLVPIYDGLHSCPEGTVRSEQALWSGTISGTDPDGEFIDSGIAGQLLFEATGTFVPTSSPGYLADAGYTTIDGTLAPQYGIQGTGDDFAAHALLSDFGTGIIGLIDWGEYNPDHIYTKYYDVAAGDGMQFVIGDRYGDWFGTDWQNQTGMDDNEGSLNLNIYECQETTSSPYCGDGTCNGDESCETCPQDCGECFTSGGGGHYHAAAEPEGEVLGEATTCGQYLFGYIEYGADNNPIEVMKLQFFLNEFMGSNLAITSVYDEATRDAVNAFQLKYGEEILQPWIDAGSHCDTNTPTGYVFITTQRWINLLKCPILNIPIADLSGFDKADCGGYSEGGQEEGQVLGEETQPSEEESAGVSEEVGLTTGPSEEKPSAEEKGSSAAIGTFFTWGNFWWLLFALIVILACIYFLSKRKKGIKE